MLRRFCLALCVLTVLATGPSYAASQRQEMQTSGALIASGNTAAFTLNTATNIMVGVDVTAISGTSPFLDLWLQASDDGGTTWYDYPADITLVSANSTTAGTLTAGARDVVNNISTGATGQYLGTYKAIAADKIRLKWIISGTTPSFTISASFVAK